MRIREGADQMEVVAERFRAASGLGGPGAPGCAAEAEPGDSGAHFHPCASPEGAPRVVTAAARAIEDAMLRALDVADGAARPDLVGDSHSFGHIIHGICVPYILLAAEELEHC